MKPYLKRLFALAALLLCLIYITACKQTGGTETATADPDILLQTAVAESFQQTQAQLPTITQPSEPTSTATTLPTAVPTIVRSQTAQSSATDLADCHRVGAGAPFDITIPDDSQIKPGQSFTKMWRLVNTGSCKWTRLYQLVFFSGNSMSAIQTHQLQSEVLPGEVVELSVEMVAPFEPGFYQSNWMLQSPEGELFGLGPNGDAPFWVRIEVIDTSTPTIQFTHTQTVTVTPTPLLSPTPDWTATPSITPTPSFTPTS